MSWMENTTGPGISSQEIDNYVDRLLKLRYAMMEAEEAYEQAKKEYEQFARYTVPDIFRMNGVNGVDTAAGIHVEVATKTTCSIVKDDEKRNKVAEWLIAHEADYLVKDQAIVPAAAIAQLEAAGIPFKHDRNMNTNSVKAWLLDALGQKGGVATITKDDIPAGLNFFQYDEMAIKA